MVVFIHVHLQYKSWYKDNYFCFDISKYPFKLINILSINFSFFNSELHQVDRGRTKWCKWWWGLRSKPQRRMEWRSLYLQDSRLMQNAWCIDTAISFNTYQLLKWPHFALLGFRSKNNNKTLVENCCSLLWNRRTMTPGKVRETKAVFPLCLFGTTMWTRWYIAIFIFTNQFVKVHVISS